MGRFVSDTIPRTVTDTKHLSLTTHPGYWVLEWTNVHHDRSRSPIQLTPLQSLPSPLPTCRPDGNFTTQPADWLLLYLLYTLRWTSRCGLAPNIGQPLIQSCLPVAGLCISSAYPSNYSQIPTPKALIASDFTFNYVFTGQKGKFHLIHLMPHSRHFLIIPATCHFWPPLALCQTAVSILHARFLILRDSFPAWSFKTLDSLSRESSWRPAFMSPFSPVCDP